MPSPADRNKMLGEIMESIIPAKETSARFKGLFYGPSGAGKTVLAAGLANQILPEGKKIVYIDTSEGYTVLRNNHPKLFENVKFVLPFKTLEHLETLAMAIKGGHPEFSDIGCIILDEHTKMSKLDLIATQQKRDPQALIPEWADYNVALQRMVRILNTLYSVADLHVIMIGHEKDKRNNKGSVVKTYPSYNPEIAKDIKESLHLVGFCSADMERDMNNPSQTKYVRKCQVQPTNLIDAKTRVDKFTGYEVSYGEVVERVVDWLNRGSPSTVEENPPAAPAEDLPDVSDYEEMEDIDLEDIAPAWESESN